MLFIRTPKNWRFEDRSLTRLVTTDCDAPVWIRLNNLWPKLSKKQLIIFNYIHRQTNYKKIRHKSTYRIASALCTSALHSWQPRHAKNIHVRVLTRSRPLISSTRHPDCANRSPIGFLPVHLTVAILRSRMEDDGINHWRLPRKMFTRTLQGPIQHRIRVCESW